MARQLKQISPTNYPDALMLQFINECEGKIQTEFLRISEIDCQRYTEDDLDKSLIVSPPHDKLYYTYLCAMIDFTNGEYSKYQNAIVISNSFMAEWAAWFNRTHRRDGREYQGVFLSAYGIAVKWGFVGTEEEWLESLVGPKGDTGAPFTYEMFTEKQLEGLRGPQGPVGPQGDKGEPGTTGPQGVPGSVGPQGPVGPTGPAGKDGSVGPTGATGATGPVGPAGADGKSAYEYAVAGGFAGTEEEFAELLANGNGGGADWSQNDPDGAGYIEGRTHYREPKYKDTFPETQVAFTSVSELVELGNGKALVDGETYFVTWNGETYQVKASVFAESGEVYVGDWDHVRYPFFVENSGPTRLYVSKATSTAESIPLRIQVQDGWTYHPFQVDYVPPGVPYAEHVDEVILPECSYDTDMDGSYVWGDYDFELIEGYVYDVVFNGTLYQCPAAKSGTFVVLRGLAYTEDFDLVGKAPFSFFFPNLRSYNGKMMCAGMLGPTPNTGTVSITGYTKVQKVDPMSMPDRTGIYVVDFAYHTDPETLEDSIIPQPDNDTAYDRARIAFDAGRTVVARCFYENGTLAGSYQLSRYDTRADWYFARMDMEVPASPVLEVLHWDSSESNPTVTVTRTPVQPQITGKVNQFVVIGKDGKPVAKELDLGGGLVVVKATDSGKANYSSTEIKELYESGHTVVFETEDSTGNKVVYQLRGLRSVQALFEYHDGSTEKADYHKSVYVDSNKLITFANTIIPVVKKTSDLENDVPFVSASDSQTLTEAQQKQARENIGAVKSWNDLEDRPFGEERAKRTIFEESEFSFVDGGVEIDYSLFSINETAYIAKFDGVEYQFDDCVSDGVICFGNLSFLNAMLGTENEDTGEPFAVVAIPDFEMAAIVAPNGNTHTVQIVGVTVDVSPVKEKYLPTKKFYYHMDNPLYLYKDTGLTIKATKTEVDTAFLNNTGVIVKLMANNNAICGVMGAVYSRRITNANFLEVCVLDVGVSGGVEIIKLYTAEYQPET